MSSAPLRVRINLEARTNLREIVADYEAVQAGLGVRLRGLFVEAVDTIVERPTSFPMFQSDVRRVRLDPFKVAAFYRVVAGELRVIGLADLRQDPLRLRRRFR